MNVAQRLQREADIAHAQANRHALNIVADVTWGLQHGPNHEWFIEYDFKPYLRWETAASVLYQMARYERSGLSK